MTLISNAIINFAGLDSASLEQELERVIRANDLQSLSRLLRAQRSKQSLEPQQSVGTCVSAVSRTSSSTGELLQQQASSSSNLKPERSQCQPQSHSQQQQQQAQSQSPLTLGHVLESTPPQVRSRSNTCKISEESESESDEESAPRALHRPSVVSRQERPSLKSETQTRKLSTLENAPQSLALGLHVTRQSSHTRDRDVVTPTSSVGLGSLQSAPGCDTNSATTSSVQHLPLSISTKENLKNGLHYAIFYNSLDSLRALLQYGLDPNAGGSSPLQLLQLTRGNSIEQETTSSSQQSHLLGSERTRDSSYCSPPGTAPTNFNGGSRLLQKRKISIGTATRLTTLQPFAGADLGSSTGLVSPPVLDARGSISEQEAMRSSSPRQRTVSTTSRGAAPRKVSFSNQVFVQEQHIPVDVPAPAPAPAPTLAPALALPPHLRGLSSENLDVCPRETMTPPVPHVTKKPKPTRRSSVAKLLTIASHGLGFTSPSLTVSASPSVTSGNFLSVEGGANAFALMTPTSPAAQSEVRAHPPAARLSMQSGPISAAHSAPHTTCTPTPHTCTPTIETTPPSFVLAEDCLALLPLPPLFMAVHLNRVDAIVELLTRDANPNAVDPLTGRTLLHLAAECGAERVECSRLLIERGARLATKDSAGRTPIGLYPELRQEYDRLLSFHLNVLINASSSEVASGAAGGTGSPRDSEKSALRECRSNTSMKQVSNGGSLSQRATRWLRQANKLNSGRRNTANEGGITAPPEPLSQQASNSSSRRSQQKEKPSRMAKVRQYFSSVKCRHFRRIHPTEGKICFSHFTLLEWNVKKCFVKLIKTLKINSISVFS